MVFEAMSVGSCSSSVDSSSLAGAGAGGSSAVTGVSFSVSDVEALFAALLLRSGVGGTIVWDLVALFTPSVSCGLMLTVNVSGIPISVCSSDGSTLGFVLPLVTTKVVERFIEEACFNG